MASKTGRPPKAQSQDQVSAFAGIAEQVSPCLSWDRCIQFAGHVISLVRVTMDRGHPRAVKYPHSLWTDCLQVGDGLLDGEDDEESTTLVDGAAVDTLCQYHNFDSRIRFFGRVYATDGPTTIVRIYRLRNCQRPRSTGPTRHTRGWKWTFG